jgi:hypothetical protein
MLRILMGGLRGHCETSSTGPYPITYLFSGYQTQKYQEAHCRDRTPLQLRHRICSQRSFGDAIFILQVQIHQAHIKMGCAQSKQLQHDLYSRPLVDGLPTLHPGRSTRDKASHKRLKKGGRAANRARETLVNAHNEVYGPVMEPTYEIPIFRRDTLTRAKLKKRQAPPDVLGPKSMNGRERRTFKEWWRQSRPGDSVSNGPYMARKRQRRTPPSPISFLSTSSFVRGGSLDSSPRSDEARPQNGQIALNRDEGLVWWKAPQSQTPPGASIRRQSWMPTPSEFGDLEPAESDDGMPGPSNRDSAIYEWLDSITNASPDPEDEEPLFEQEPERPRRSFSFRRVLRVTNLNQRDISPSEGVAERVMSPEREDSVQRILSPLPDVTPSPEPLLESMPPRRVRRRLDVRPEEGSQPGTPYRGPGEYPLSSQPGIERDAAVTQEAEEFVSHTPQPRRPSISPLISGPSTPSTFRGQTIAEHLDDVAAKLEASGLPIVPEPSRSESTTPEDVRTTPLQPYKDLSERIVPEEARESNDLIVLPEGYDEHTDLNAVLRELRNSWGDMPEYSP